MTEARSAAMHRVGEIDEVVFWKGEPRAIPAHEIDFLDTSAPARSAEPVDIAKALRRAYSLGKTYWQQADRDSYKQHKLSDITHQKFEDHVAEVVAACIAEPNVKESLKVEPTDEQIVILAADFRSTYQFAMTTFEEFDAVGFARAVLALTRGGNNA